MWSNSCAQHRRPGPTQRQHICKDLTAMVAHYSPVCAAMRPYASLAAACCVHVQVYDVAWCPTNSAVFAAVTADGRLELWDFAVSTLRPVCQHAVTKHAMTALMFAKVGCWGLCWAKGLQCLGSAHVCAAWMLARVLKTASCPSCSLACVVSFMVCTCSAASCRTLLSLCQQLMQACCRCTG